MPMRSGAAYKSAAACRSRSSTARRFSKAGVVQDCFKEPTTMPNSRRSRLQAQWLVMMEHTTLTSNSQATSTGASEVHGDYKNSSKNSTFFKNSYKKEVKCKEMIDGQ